MSDLVLSSSLKWRIAVCLSIRRLDNLERMLGSLLAQGYEPCHVFVAVKGVTKDCFREVVLPRYKKWIDLGVVTLRHYPVKNRVSDLLDAVRGMELDDWDLFVFPRESLFCSPDMLERIQRIYTQWSPSCPSYEGGTCRVLKECRGYQYVAEAEQTDVPSYYVLTRAALEYLQRCEHDPGAIAALFSDGVDPRHGEYGLDADALLMLLIKHMHGKDLSSVEKSVTLLAPVSVACHNPLAEIEETLHESVNDDPARAEYLVELEHPYWNDYMRVLGTAGCRVSLAEKATVLRFTDRELVLQWEEWDRECFRRDQPEGPYRLHRRSAQPVRKKGKSNSADLVALALEPAPVRWGVCAVAIPRESYYWLEDWIAFHLRAGASLVVIYDNTGSTGSLRGDTPFCAGALQREGRSKRNEEYGRLTEHLSDEKIRKKLGEIAARYGVERVKVLTWQPRHPKTRKIVHGQVEGYEDFIRRFRKDVDWCAFIDMDEYLCCRPGLSINRILEYAEKEMPDVARIMMKGWKFRMRWGLTGPCDLKNHLDHLPLSDGGEKNLVRLHDVVKADIHWYWEQAPGFRHVTAHPEDVAFCHYNLADEEMVAEDAQRLISPRAFLNASEEDEAAFRLW